MIGSHTVLPIEEMILEAEARGVDPQKRLGWLYWLDRCTTCERRVPGWRRHLPCPLFWQQP